MVAAAAMKLVPLAPAVVAEQEPIRIRRERVLDAMIVQLEKDNNLFGLYVVLEGLGWSSVFGGPPARDLARGARALAKAARAPELRVAIGGAIYELDSGRGNFAEWDALSYAEKSRRCRIKDRAIGVAMRGGTFRDVRAVLANIESPSTKRAA